MNGGCILKILGRIQMIAPLIPIGWEDGDSFYKYGVRNLKM